MAQPKLITDLPEESSPTLTEYTVIEDGSTTRKVKWSTIKALFGIGGAVWGAITGNLTDQTDLANALNGKLDLNGSNANTDIDVGNYAINAKSFKANGTNGNGKLGLKHQASDATSSASETVIYAATDGELYAKNDGNAKVKITTATDLSSGLSGKQATLVSGTNIKTVNGSSLLGSGNIDASVTMVESISLEDANTSISSKTYVIELYAAYPYNINQLKIKSASGTCTAALKINGTNVTGISAVSVSSTIATGTASGANSVSVGDTVTLVISSTSSLADLQASIKTTRT